jgi:UDP-N-acetyl-D-mannosaminuronic acid dehydrogenase
VLTYTHDVCIIGAGFVGLTLAGKILKKDFTSVTLLENNPDKCFAIKSNNFAIYEPGLADILEPAQFSGRLKILNTTEEQYFDTVFVCIGTQQVSRDPNGFQNLVNLIASIQDKIKVNGQIFIRSTVQLGVTEKIGHYLSGFRPDINVSFAPERTVEGIALKELDELPQILGLTSNSLEITAKKALQELGFEVITASNSTSAEFTKLISNSWRDTQFAISNEIALLAELTNINPYEVIELCNFNYPRSKIPYPGPVGGPCLSKDTHILFDSFNDSNKRDSLIFNARLKNENLFKIACKLIRDFQKNSNKKISILFMGAAFKGSPITNDIRKGLAENVILELSEESYNFSIWDSNLKSDDITHVRADLVDDLKSLRPDIVVFGNNSPVLSSSDLTHYYSSLSADTLFIDFWGITNKLKIDLKHLYVFGREFQKNS